MLASCRKAAWRALACNPGDAGRPFEPADSLNVGNRASNLGSPTGCSGSSLCENECRTGSAEKSTRQNGPGSTIVASPRVGGPPKLLVARVFTQARSEAVLYLRLQVASYATRMGTTPAPLRSFSKYSAQDCIISRRAGRCSAWLYAALTE